MIFSRGKKPILMKYKEDVKLDKNLYMNVVRSEDNRIHSFRCPNNDCGRPVKIGYLICPFCNTKLKWEYPFEIVEEDMFHGREI